MKKSDITFLDKLNELRLDISHPNSKGIAFILVEGDTDIRLYRKLFNLSKCKVESVPGGNTKLEECVEELLNSDPLVFGIRDSDFIYLSDAGYEKKNIFLTDFHDIEMSLIFEDEAFNSIAFEYTDIINNQHEMRDDVINIITEISYLKWLNSIENLEMSFTPGFQNLINLRTGEIDLAEYFKRVIAKSPNIKLNDFTVVQAKIEELKKEAPDLRLLCNGHDFISTLTIYLRAKGKATGGINELSLHSAFRMNYKLSHLQKTKLYQDTLQWSKAQNCSIYE